MRILHLSKYYHPYRGGIEKVIKELAEASVKQGHNVTVICSSENNQGITEIVNGVHVIRLPQWGTVFSQPLTPSVFWSVKNFFAAAEVIHLHAPNPLFEFACLTVPFTAPLVVTFHCEVMKSRWLNRFYEPVSKSVLQKADRILVATPLHIEFSFWLKEFKNKCEVIPFGIEPKFENKSLEMNEQLLKIKNTYGRYFLFVGRMVTYKGVNFLLEAMKSVPQNLVLIGKGPFLETWKKLSEELGVAERVHFVGPVESDVEFGAYLHGADALVLPSINEAEAFGLVLLEAMSCKKPVITTDLNSGVKFVNIHGKTGLEVPRKDAPLLAHAMNQLRNNDALRLRLGQQAFEHFRHHFLIQSCWQKHLDVYLNTAKKAAA
jgi:glycosyltransferase involved in cell wall biosynthesis